MKTLMSVAYKPIQDVYAMQWLPEDYPPNNRTPADKMRDWLNAYEADWRTSGLGTKCVIHIETPEGQLECNPGDWIIMISQPNMESDGPDDEEDMIYYFRVVSQFLFLTEYEKR